MVRLMFVALVLCVSVATGCTNTGQESQETANAPEAIAPWLGQTPPGVEPEKFAPAILQNTFCVTFSPDGMEMFTSAYDPDPAADRVWIARFTFADGTWQGPEVAPFSGTYKDFDICMAPDGSRVYFRSNRPLPGETETYPYTHIWSAERTDSGWSEAQPVIFVRAGFPSVTAGGTLFFGTSVFEDKVGPSDIYMARPADDGRYEPANAGSPPNTEYGEGDLFVAPDGGYIIFSGYENPENNGEQDLYISFRNNDGTWTEPVNMGAPINTAYGENCPYVSPGGEYLFFNRYATGDLDVAGQGTHWIDASVIERFRPGMK